MSKSDSKDSIDIDLSKVKNLLKFNSGDKKVKYGMISVLLLIALVFSFHVRSYSSDLEVTDQWAAQTINQQILNEATARVQQQYPSLQGAQLQQRANELANTLRSQMGDTFDQQVQAQGDAFRSRLQVEMSTGDQQTYLLAIDPWQFYRLTDNYLENGHPGDEIRDGRSWNNHMLAPNGVRQEMNLHIWFSALWHKIFNIFKPGAELLQSFFWVPVFVSMLAVIPAFFIVYRRTNMLGGFTAALLVAIHPYFVTRTAAGFSDTDAYNVFFPLLIAWFVLEAFEAKKFKNSLIFSGLAGLSVGIFSFAWIGWWYVFDFLLISILAVIWYTIAEKTLAKLKWDWYYKILYFLAPVLLGLIIFFAAANFVLYASIILLLAYVAHLAWVVHPDYIKKKDKHFINRINKFLASGAIFFVGSAIFVTLFKNFNSFINGMLNPFSFNVIQNAAKANLWPNVYTTVAELNRASIGQIITNIGFNINGGLFFFFIAILGIALSFIKTKPELKDWIILGSTALVASILLKNVQLDVVIFVMVLALPALLGMYFSLGRDVDIIYAILLTVWFMGTVYASTLGIRFILLMVPVFAVAVGIAFGQLSKILEYFTFREFDMKENTKKLVPIIFFILFALVLIRPVQAGINVGQGEVPSFDDAWWESLKQIESDSQPDAIINSWWDFGHWFKAVADRAVTFDGASQNTPQAHWIGRALSAQTQEETIGILRMLDCGGNDAQVLIEDSGLDQLGSIELTKQIIVLDRNDAEEALVDAGVTNTEEILAKTHCEPPENYFITSGDMVGKSGVWSHFGNWDFNKAFVYNAVKNNPRQAEVLAKEQLSISDDEVESLLFQARGFNDDQANNWIGPFDGYIGGGRWFSCSGNTTLTCNVGLGLGRDGNGNSNVIETLVFNTLNPEETNLTAGVYDSANQRIGGADLIPSRIIYTGQNNLEVQDFEGGQLSNLDFIVDTESRRVMVAGRSVSQSTFTKLFFLNGKYMDNFERLSDRTSVTGNRIIVWKVLW